MPGEWQRRSMRAQAVSARISRAVIEGGLYATADVALVTDCTIPGWPS